MTDIYGLLLKVKITLGIDEDDLSHDDYIEGLLQSMIALALRRTGRSTLDDLVVEVVDEVVVETYVPNFALEEAVVKNVALKFDDINAAVDYSVFHQYNTNPML